MKSLTNEEIARLLFDEGKDLVIEDLKKIAQDELPQLIAKLRRLERSIKGLFIFFIKVGEMEVISILKGVLNWAKS